MKALSLLVVLLAGCAYQGDDTQSQIDQLRMAQERQQNEYQLQKFQDQDNQLNQKLGIPLWSR